MSKLTAFPFQERDIRALLNGGMVALLNIEMGGTKTFIALEAGLQSGAKQVLVIAPLSTHQSAWGQTLRRQGGEEIRVIGNGRKAEREAYADFLLGTPGWYIATPQWFTREDSEGWNPDLVIVDEIHKLGNPTGKGAEKLIALGKRVKWKLALSGTPARNKFERMWTIMRFLWPDNQEIARENYHVWLSEHMLFAKQFTGLDQYRRPKYARKYIRERKQGGLLSEAPLVLQHFRRDRCCEFHPEGFLSQKEPQVLTREVQLSAKQKRAIKELEEQYLTWLDENPLVVEIPLTLQQRVRQMCLAVPTLTEDDELVFTAEMESPFADELEEILDDLAGEPVVIYVESQRFAAALTARLVSKGYSAFEYSGATVKTRSENLAKFGTPDGHQILIGTIPSIGEGTDGMQRVAKTEIFLERSTDETLNQQAESRLDRTGAIGQVQRIVFTDSEGYALGRWSKQVDAAMELRKSLVVPVDIPATSK